MPAATVSAQVRAAHRGRILLVAIESSVVGLSAAIATLAAGASAQVDLGDPQMRILLTLVGLLGAFAWWLERGGDEASVARSIDRRFGWKGALTTAFEAESVAIRTPVAAALAAGIAPRVSPRRFLANEARSSAAVLAAPFLALALFGAVREGRMFPDDPRAIDPRSAASSSARFDRVADLRARTRSLASTPGVSAEDRVALEALAERAGRQDPRLADSTDAKSAIADLEADVARWERTIEASRAPESGAGVASTARDGTMGGRDSRSEPRADDSMRETQPSMPVPNAVDGPGAEGGVGASRWWPARYDGVVERWIEARRAAAGGRTR